MTTYLLGRRTSTLISTGSLQNRRNHRQHKRTGTHNSRGRQNKNKSNSLRRSIKLLNARSLHHLSRHHICTLSTLMSNRSRRRRQDSRSSHSLQNLTSTRDHSSRRSMNRQQSIPSRLSPKLGSIARQIVPNRRRHRQSQRRRNGTGSHRRTKSKHPSINPRSTTHNSTHRHLPRLRKQHRRY